MNKQPIKNIINGEFTSNIYPFFWLHGKDRSKILPELQAVKSAGIKNICVESRGHTSFGSEDWFADLDIVMEFARTNNMKVWLLDDAAFPTGYANGAFKKPENKSKAKITLSHEIIYDTGGGVRYFDVTTFYNMPYFNIFGSLEGIVLAKRGEKAGELYDFVDVTDKLQQNGLVRLELPSGKYALIVVFNLMGGGRENYMNLLDAESVDLLIQNVYEPHYQRYKDYFSTTFCGFFSDEPELGNFSQKTGLGDYRLEDKIGDPISLPFSSELSDNLKKLWKDDYVKNLCSLWIGKGQHQNEIRAEYMEQMTQLVKKNFSSKIGDWCCEHGVEYVGHVLEDQNAHARLSAGAGHYFRSTFGMSYAGIDVVLAQVLPHEHDDTGGIVFSKKADREFYSYALASLAASFARIDKKKKGRSLCEIFGAYGWSEGTSLMKYLADLMLCGGINHFVPHAFSDAAFPDFDCPPHFYAEGKNPQFTHFAKLIAYMDRMGSLIGGGRCDNKCAVLYHAEAEWSGASELMQKPIRALTDNQIPFDIVPLDAFFDSERYDLPAYEYLFVPKTLLAHDKYKKMLQLVQQNSKQMKILPYEDALTATNHSLLEQPTQGVRAYSYIKDGQKILLLFNTNPKEVVVQPKSECGFYQYDAMDNMELPASKKIQLYSREMKVLVFDSEAVNAEVDTFDEMPVDAEFTVSMFDPSTFSFVPVKRSRELVDMNEGALDRYAGVYRYNFELTIPKNCEGKKAQLHFCSVHDSMELTINNQPLAARVAPPFVYDIGTLQSGVISVQADVYTTLGRAVRDPFSRYRALEPCGICGKILLKTKK